MKKATSQPQLLGEENGAHIELVETDDVSAQSTRADSIPHDAAQPLLKL